MARSNSDHNGWTWVFGKNKHHQTKPIDNPYVKDVEKIATSFFVTNFPNSLDAKNTWKEFQPFGRIIDAFFANKRSKQGKRFGFVRFLGIHNEEVFAKSISNVWIESYHVFVSVAKFQRNPIKPHASTQQLPKASHDRPTFNTNNLPSKRLYASITHAESRNNLSQQSKLDNIKSIQLNDDDLILVEDSSTVVLIKLQVLVVTALSAPSTLSQSWIFSTLAPSLRKRLVDLNPTTAKDAWTYIADLSIDGYFQKIEYIVSVLNGLGSPLSNDDVVTFALEDLPSTDETIYAVIVSREPFMDLKMVRSLLTTHEMRLNSRVQNPLVDATSASPMVLLAKSNTSAWRGPFLKKVNNPCWSFAKGSCRFGDACKYLHNGVHDKSTLLPRTSGSASIVSDVTRSDLDMLQSMLAKFGLNVPNTFTPSPPVAYTVSVPPGFPSVSAQLFAQPTYVSPQLLPGSFGGSNMGMAGLFPQGVQYPTRSLQHGVYYPHQGVQMLSGPPQGQGGSFPGSVHLGQSPSMPFHPSQPFASGSQGSGQATLFPNAFNTTTLLDPASGNWNMDTGASSHLNDSIHCLSDILNMCIYPSVAVGDGHFIPDFITRRVLLRYDSTGDFYPVTKPSTIPHAFLSNKLPVLCHACQVGKHVKLLFVSLSSSVTSCFDIVHSDLWTSSISSLSGFQYYVLFIDHYSQYVWVYPLMNKYDVLSKFMLFRNYVRTQFKCEIKSFLCNHGGEFDNHTFHKLFHDNCIQFKFSCPRTSQQNGKSKRMIHTLNNLIRTLLFQAHLPPNYWTQAHNMAVYLLNILPSRAINNEIPFTRLFGAQPDYSVLPVFGCLCYPYIDTNHKLRPRATSSIYLGHAANHFGYRFLDLNTNKIIISYHVTFNETVFPFPSTKSTTTPSSDFFDDSTDLCSTIIRTAPITPVLAPVHTLQVDVPTPLTPPTPPTPPPPPTPQSVPQIVPKHAPIPTNDSPTMSIHPMVTHSRVGTTRPNPRYIIASLHREFSMTDFGALNYFLGISVMRDSSGMFLSQRKYAMEILERAHMVGCNPSRTPVDIESKLGDGGTPVVDPTLYRSLASSLQYFTFTRPDITYVVQQVCLYMHDPREPHFSTLKRILRYVQGTLDYGLQLFSSTTDSLIAYSDADWAGRPTTRRSTLRYCVFLGNNLLSWSSKRQPTLSHSSAEAEYRGVTNAVAETCWIRNLLRKLHNPLSSATIVYCDNVHVLHVPSRFQYVDIFTKGLPSALFDEFRDSLSVRCTPAPTAREY
nr:ribonuclease H-like domain-containing protein [Tanacetum cinerariifolium]